MSDRKQAMNRKALERWNKHIGTFLGYPALAEHFRFDRAVSAATVDQIQDWDSVLTDAIAAIEEIRERIRLAVQEEYGELPEQPNVWSIDCMVCGTMFDATRSDAKYCSDACRQKAYRERKKRGQS